MAMARTLVAGSDVWLNNPLRPYEACGTSGMKAALNGCLNLSIRDGWWDELYDGQNGWAIPSADDPTIEPERGTSSRRRPSTTCSSTRSCRCSTTGRTAAQGLDRDDQAQPGLLGPAILASRMVRDYTEATCPRP